MANLCIYIPGYNAGKFIEKTVQRIPFDDLPASLEYSVLFIDNHSTDDTRDKINLVMQTLEESNISSDSILNDRNLGYGGSVKKAFDYCIDRNFEFVAVLHADGQYAPELLPLLINEILTDTGVALVFGSRLLGEPLKGGMPLYKYLANMSLTRIQNMVLGRDFSEYHSGYRLYRLDMVKKTPYRENSDYFDFDNQIIFQICHFGFDIREIPIPTHYGDEKSHVSPLRTPLAILKNMIVYMMHRSGIIKSSIYS